MRQFSQRFFPPMAGLLSLVLIWLALGMLREDKFIGGAYSPVLCGAVVTGVAAIAVWLEWKGAWFLALLSGIVLCVIATFAMVLGLASGAPAFAILLAPVLLFVAVTGFVLLPNKSSPR